MKVGSHDFRLVSSLFSPLKDLLEENGGIASRLGFENAIVLVGKSVFIGFQLASTFFLLLYVFVSFYLLYVSFLIHGFLCKNIYFI